MFVIWRAMVTAVEVIATLKKPGQPTQLILVRQFRPPTGIQIRNILTGRVVGSHVVSLLAQGLYCIELPAGLCDTGEAPEVTAVREMKEETGYTAKVIDVSPSLIVRTLREESPYQLGLKALKCCGINSLAWQWPVRRVLLFML